MRGGVGKQKRESLRGRGSWAAAGAHARPVSLWHNALGQASRVRVRLQFEWVCGQWPVRRAGRAPQAVGRDPCQPVGRE
eukprot:1111509-Prymnesium_polylepis.1